MVVGGCNGAASSKALRGQDADRLRIGSAGHHGFFSRNSISTSSPRVLPTSPNRCAAFSIRDVNVRVNPY